jgi:hypothetical protein
MVLYLRVLIVFSLHRESLKLILATDPFSKWFSHMVKYKNSVYTIHDFISALSDSLVESHN